METIPQERIGKILDNIKNEKSYYAGGTLCVDKVLPNSDVLVMNLDGYFGGFSGDFKGTLSDENVKKLFDIYKEHKGETQYYKLAQVENLIK